MDGTAAHLDRISALPDDLLHVILTFLGDARDVTRTAALSRRWRHVWIHAKNLSFDDGDLTNNSVPGHLAGFVDWALAQRGDVDMESLKIHFFENVNTSPEKVNEWLRYAAGRVVKSVDVYLGEPNSDPHAAVELPGHGRMTSISLSLWNRRFQLPSAAAARYEALTELNLAFLSFTNGAGSTFGDFVSSCCPRLRLLHIALAEGLLRLVLRSEALEKLDIFGAGDMRMLDVTAPNLRAIRLASCFHNPIMSSYYDVNKVARIVAPRLQELEISCLLEAPPPELDIHDLPSVRRLNNLVLHMHGKYCRGNNGLGLSLLEKCYGVEHVEVSLKHQKVDVIGNGNLIDPTTEGCVAAQFAKLRSMDISAYFFPVSHLVASIASLLTRCSCLRSLSVRIVRGTTQDFGWRKCFCDALEDKWKIHGNLVLEVLEDVIITGFTGADEEMKLVSLLFESSNSIKCMALSETPGKIDIAALTQKIGKEVESNNTLLQKLTNVPCANRGHWHFVEQVFVWTCDATKRSTSIGQRKMY